MDDERCAVQFQRHTAVFCTDSPTAADAVPHDNILTGYARSNKTSGCAANEQFKMNEYRYPSETANAADSLKMELRTSPPEPCLTVGDPACRLGVRHNERFQLVYIDGHCGALNFSEPRGKLWEMIK